MSLFISKYHPSNELMPFIESYWFGSFNLNNKTEFSQSVVPNGCIELIIHITDAHCALTKKKDKWNKSPDFTLLGLHTQPYDVQFSSTVTVFAIRFHPDGIHNIFGVSPSEFSDTFEDGLYIFGANFKAFCNEIRASESIETKIKIADKFLISQLKLNYQSHDYTHVTMNLIRKAADKTNYKAITDQIPISNRQLQRTFKQQYGITVSEYMRLARINAIHNYMLSNQTNFTKLSHDLHFCDQSHFIREFKHYLGLTPTKFMKTRHRFIINAVEP